MGYEGVKTIVRKLRDQQVPPQKVDTGVELVTKARLSEPEIKNLLSQQ